MLDFSAGLLLWKACFWVDKEELVNQWFSCTCLWWLIKTAGSSSTFPTLINGLTTQKQSTQELTMDFTWSISMLCNGLTSLLQQTHRSSQSIKLIRTSLGNMISQGWEKMRPTLSQTCTTQIEEPTLTRFQISSSKGQQTSLNSKEWMPRRESLMSWKTRRISSASLKLVLKTLSMPLALWEKFLLKFITLILRFCSVLTVSRSCIELLSTLPSGITMIGTSTEKFLLTISPIAACSPSLTGTS